jgi:hypothetical protein
LRQISLLKTNALSRFAQWIEAEASATHLSLLRVDGNRTIEQNAEAVARHFQLSLDQSQE